MSEIEKLLTDYKNDNLNDLIFDNNNFANSVGIYKKLYIYKNKKLQKVWVKTPKLKVARNTLDLNKIGSLSNNIVLYLLLGNTVFSRFIKKVESKISDHIKSLVNKELKLKSNINNLSANFPTTFSVNMPFKKVQGCYDFCFNIYDINNRRVNINNITSGVNTVLFIELSDVWLKVNDNNYTGGINWNILQMKIYPEFDFSKCLFIEEGEEMVEGKEECYHCKYCPSVYMMRTHVCGNPYVVTPQVNMQVAPPPPPPVREISIKPYAPSIGDLLKVKLKPVDKTKMNIKTRKYIDKKT